jgi:hypothetical protein
MMQVIPSRSLNGLYILLDCLFLVLFCAALLWQKKRLTFLFAMFGGILYFLVDWGIFYHLLGTRKVTGMNATPFLFWLSMSYGITNFAWIWLWLEKDKHVKEWALLIISGWFCSALLSQQYGGPATIHIERGTAYHGIMALILFVGYVAVVLHNFMEEDQISVVRLNIIGIVVQFSWEAVLLVCGIRNPGFGPIVVDSLIETNLGLPYIYFIQKAVLSRWNEDLSANKPLRTN